MRRQMQREILEYLVDNGPMKDKNCTKVLYEVLDVKQGAVTDTLRRLEDKGFIKRTVKARRVIEVFATPEGETHLASKPRKTPKPDTPTAVIEVETSPPMPPKSNRRLALGTMVRVVGTFITEDERIEYVVESNGTRYLLAEVGHE